MYNDLNVLIIDTDPSIMAKIEGKVKLIGFSLLSSAEANSTIHQLKILSPDLTILGPSMGTEKTLRCIQKLKIIDPMMPILTPCEDGCFSGASVNSGSFDGVHYLKPDSDPEEILSAIKTALEYKAEREIRPDFPILIGQSREIKAIRQKVQHVGDKDITVLITGETGTGKELIARSIHYHSWRSGGPLIKINCGALPDELLESEVFGFQKGAFTGAHKDKPGRLEMADGGTLFIDEIGSLSLSLQAKFLQVLEDRAFSRLGGVQDKAVDTRVVAATNSDLRAKVREGTFRKDLFHRLNILHIESPPLRRRDEDIPLMSHYFLNKYCFEVEKDLMNIPKKISKLFLLYHWPGNVREFENVIRRAIVLRDWNSVVKELNLAGTESESKKDPSSGDDLSRLHWYDEKVKKFLRGSSFSLKKVSKAYVSEAERQAILQTLEETQWNRTKAAELLQVSYKTLLNRIEEYDLKPEE